MSFPCVSRQISSSSVRLPGTPRARQNSSQNSRERLSVWFAAFVGAAAFLVSSAIVVLAGSPQPAHAATDGAIEPYGGCAEAWQAPRSAGADLCRELGYTVSARFVLSPRGVVLHSSLPHCAYEDGSGGRRPCTWNVGRRVDGNGIGLAYKVRRDMSVRYVWPTSPAVDGWRWVSERQARRLAGRFIRPAERRSVAAWQRCVLRHDGTRARCADGARYRLR